MGVVAANIVENSFLKSIGSYESEPTLFTHNYEYALGIAAKLAEGNTDWQWDDDVHGDYLRTRGYSLPGNFPSAVVALSPEHHDPELLDIEALRSQHYGSIPHIALAKVVTVGMLDAHSQAFITEFFTCS